jgi:hypothetical protein
MHHTIYIAVFVSFREVLNARLLRKKQRARAQMNPVHLDAPAVVCKGIDAAARHAVATGVIFAFFEHGRERRG